MDLIPKFSIRQMLLTMIGIGVVCACLGSAARGSIIGFGLSVGLAMLILIAIVVTCMYWVLFAAGCVAGVLQLGGPTDTTKISQPKTSIPTPTTADDWVDEQQMDPEQEGNA